VRTRDKSAILKEIVALSTLPNRQENDWTTIEYAEEARCARSTARRRLQRLVEKGVLQCEKRLGIGGGPVMAYWKVSPLVNEE